MMSVNIKLKNDAPVPHQITSLDENKKLASIALKRVDQLIKMKDYQKALLEIDHVREIDNTNVYAFALEERIKILLNEDAKVEKQKEQVLPPQSATIKTAPPQSACTTLQTGGKEIVRQPSALKETQLQQCSGKADSQDIHCSSDHPSAVATSILSGTYENKCNKPLTRMPKVVLIDDDVHLLNVLKMTIESGGFEVISLSTSDEAYMLLRKLVPDIILCDINLETSTMGGFTFFEKIHQIETMKHVPFIFLSGLSDDVLIRTGKEMGADDYLTKPIKEQNLLAAIRGRIKRFEELGLSHSPTTYNAYDSSVLSRISS